MIGNEINYRKSTIEHYESDNDVMGKVFLPQGDSQIACYDL